MNSTKENYPNLKNYPGSKTGVGVHEGMEAAQTVGLDKQTEGIYNKKINESQFWMNTTILNIPEILGFST